MNEREVCWFVCARKSASQKNVKESELHKDYLSVSRSLEGYKNQEKCNFSSALFVLSLFYPTFGLCQADQPNTDVKKYRSIGSFKRS